MRYLLDSNAIIAIMANQPAIMTSLATVAPSDVGVSSIVMFELIFGAFNSARVSNNLERLQLLEFPVLEFGAKDARAAGQIRATLKRSGMPIGPYDVLIAGQAMARRLSLVTANTAEFSRVDDLTIENWIGND